MNSIVQQDISSILDSPLPWQVFTNKVVLITGANGFLAAYLVETLIALNSRLTGGCVKIIALVRNKMKAEIRFNNYLSLNSNLQIIEHDVCNKLILNEHVDYIIHAASQASPKYYATDPVGTLNANVTGTLNMLNFAKLNNVDSFLYFSSGEVYGELSDQQIPMREDEFGYLNPTKVRSCYGESKRMGENICVSYHHQYNVKAKIVRPFHTYGPGMDLNDGRVYADFIADVLAKRDLVIKSDGSAKRAFCYLEDATIAFFTILIKGVDGEAYNMGNPNEEFSISELAKVVASLSSNPIKVITEGQPIKKTNYLKSSVTRSTPSIEKIMALGWIPTTTVKEGFKRTIDSYCHNF